jgi:hypothetical protein
MTDLKPDKWTPADLDILLTDVIAAVESGEIDSAFDNTELTSGHLTKAKNTRNYTKKLPCADGNPDVEIYIKDGDRVLYGEKILPRGVLTENFLDVTGSSLFKNQPD